MIVSMLISLRELQISVGALDLLLMELEEGRREGAEIHMKRWETNVPIVLKIAIRIYRNLYRT